MLAAAAEGFANQINSVELGLVKTHPASDDVPHTIVRESQRWHVDLAVVGTQGRRGFSRWFPGSVAGRTAPITQTPLLMVRPPTELFIVTHAKTDSLLNSVRSRG